MDETLLTLQEILEEAGLIHRQNQVSLTVGGDNKSITIPENYLFDTDYDDEVTVNDVIVFVDGVERAVASVDDEKGVIKLTTALVDPNQQITASYNYSSVHKRFVRTVRSESISEIKSKIPCTKLLNEYQSALKYIVRLHAAGMLLIKDYGFNEDIEGTSKDGYKKIELANTKLKELIKSVCGVDLDAGSGSGSSSGGFDIIDEGDLFRRRRGPSCEFSDRCFEEC